MSQMNLFGEKRFGPLFWTQFLGAFNDNLFKNALVILIAFRSVQLWGMATEQLVALSAGIFILPFFLLSASAGQLSDKFSKPRLMRWVKLAEIFIMGAAALGFIFDNIYMLLGVLFLMGTQSTFFGPAKYSVLPELVNEDELVGANALIEMGTFVAILLGTIAGGVLIGLGENGPLILAASVVTIAVTGWLVSQRIPHLPGASPELTVNINPVTPTWDTFKATRQNRPVFLSILGISWFWFLGASILTVLPNYCKDLLNGNEHVVTFFLALFCVGIAIGSVLCERMSHRTLELGLVPLGSIGMTIFLFDLFLAGGPSAAAGSNLSLGAALQQPGVLRVAIDFSLLSVFSGFYTVPMYTLMQQRSDPESRSRVIAGNNILNAFFMVVSSGLLMAVLAAGVSIPQIFGLLALLNAIAAMYIYTVLPEFLWRFVLWVMARVMYRVKAVGVDNFPATGPAVLVCNHVTFVDWLIVGALCPRPIRFVMDNKFTTVPGVSFFLRGAKVIPIAPAHQNEEVLKAAFDTIASELEDNEIVCIFPEGRLTKDGTLGPFRTGVERILARTPVPVIPMSLEGMWGSFFSRKGGKAFTGAFQRIRSRVKLTVEPPVQPHEVTAQGLAEKIAGMGGWEVPEPG